jgi:hypothetical protein
MELTLIDLSDIYTLLAGLYGAAPFVVCGLLIWGVWAWWTTRTGAPHARQ